MLNSRRLDLVPGTLSATVHLHEIATGSGVVRGWTLVSEGLTSVGQSEMAFTLVRESDRAEDFPPFLLNHLLTVRQFAAEGQFVSERGFTHYRAGAMSDLGPFAGIGYTAPDRSVQVPLPAQCLTGVLLTEGELEMWMRCFAERVLSKLGHLTRHFPYPYWSDPGRPSVYTPGDSKKSLISEIPRLRAEGSTATLAGGEITLSLRPAEARVVADRMAAGDALCVMVGRDPGVLAALVWGPGQEAPIAIIAEGADGAAVAGWFVVLVPAQGTNDEVGMREDGFTVLLTKGSARRLVTSLRRGEPFRVAKVGNSPALLIRLNESDAYQNPVDGKTYVAEGGWRTFGPKAPFGPAPETSEPNPAVRLEGVRLLSSPEEFEASVDVQPLAALNEYILGAATEALGVSSSALELLVQCTLSPTSRPAFRFSTKGNVDPNLLRHFDDLLHASPDLRSRQATVSFQTHLVKPGEAPPR